MVINPYASLQKMTVIQGMEMNWTSPSYFQRIQCTSQLGN